MSLVSTNLLMNAYTYIYTRIQWILCHYNVSSSYKYLLIFNKNSFGNQISVECNTSQSLKTHYIQLNKINGLNFVFGTVFILVYIVNDLSIIDH